ncbi:MAG: sodium:solute symporter family protein [Chitinispirillaceae bacterium]|nr:sodium:solute symporter family protein [Chitinispirillaceae bacterium]
MMETAILWVIVIGYMTFIFIKGVSKVKEIDTTDDFLLAGRNVGWLFLFCTMGATVIGGGASIGAIGRTYDWGILMVLVSTGWYIHFLFSGLVVAPQFRAAKLYTVAGFFGHRYGEGPRFVALVLSLLFSVFIVAAQMAAFGSVLSAILPQFADSAVVLKLAILIGGTMVVIYSTAGGLKAVIQTDVYQFIILFIGFCITVAFCLPDLLHIDGATLRKLPATFFSPHGGKGWVMLITTFLAFLLGETFAPGYATRYCVGKNIKETRRGIAGVGIFLAFTFPIILFVIALYARIHFPDIDPQQALPMVIRQLNNPVIAGLIVGALLMAVMSSADSALNSSTAIFVKDLFEHQLGWTDSKERPLLKIARICSCVLGGIAILIAILWSDIIQLLLFTYHVWAPAVILPVIVGAVMKERSVRYGRHVFITMVVSTVSAMLYKGALTLHGKGTAILPDSCYVIMEKVDTSVFGVLVSLVVFTVTVLVVHTSPEPMISDPS